MQRFMGAQKSLFDWTVGLQTSPSLVKMKYETEGIFQQLEKAENLLSARSHGCSWASE